MSTFAKSGFRSTNYESFRPRYPSSFYDILSKYIGSKEVEKTLDLGCGTAVATFPLLNISHYVYGTDLSPSMIKTANDLKEERLKKMGISDTSRIDFAVSAVEDLQVEAELYDLITAAECIHWFRDLPTFFSSAAKYLKPQGVLAYWYYVDPVFVGFKGPGDKNRGVEEVCKAADKIYNKYAYTDPNWFGKHWEQPGRNILRDLCVEVDNSIPSELFEDITIKKSQLTEKRDFDEDDLQILKHGIPLTSFVKYMTTFGAAHNYAEIKGEGSLEDFEERILEDFENDLGWDRDSTTVDIAWHTGYTFMRKK